MSEEHGAMVETQIQPTREPEAVTAPVTEGALALAHEPEGAAEAPARRRRGRRKRRTRARARTISIRRLSKTELNRGRMLYPETDYWKPTSRADCVDMERPCPYVSCKYHLYIDVHSQRGSIKMNFTDIEVWEMTETCALDVADRGGITLEEVVVEIVNPEEEQQR